MFLGLDLATNLGACWGDGADLPSLAHHRLPSTGDDVGRFLCAYEDWLREKLDEVCPVLICFEAPVLPRPKWNPASKKIEGGTASSALDRQIALARRTLGAVDDRVSEERD